VDEAQVVKVVDGVLNAFGERVLSIGGEL